MTPLKNFIHVFFNKNNRRLAGYVAAFAFISNSQRDFFGNWSLLFGWLFLAISLGLLIYFIFRDGDKWVLTSFNEVFRRLISAERGTIYDVMGVLAILYLTSWAADACFKGDVLAAVTNTLNIVNMLIVFVRYHPGKDESSQLQKSANLFMALSTLNVDRNRPESKDEFLRDIREAIHEKNVENFVDTKCNWALPLRSICFHGEKLQNLFLLLSPEAEKGYQEHFAGLLDEYKNIYGVNFEVHEIKGVKINNFDSIIDKVTENFPKEIPQDTTSITFNVSGGTAAVSGAFMLFAVKGDWQVEYFTQVADKQSSELTLIKTRKKIFL